MNRIAFRMKLKPGKLAAYRERHDAIWPELVALLKEAGISQYSIFIDHSTYDLFAFQLNEGAANSQDLAANPIVRKWWDYMADLMEVNPDNSPVSTPLTEVFFLP